MGGVERKVSGPFEVPTVPGCEEWREMYPSYMLFGKYRSEDDNRFWIRNSMHFPEVFRPLDLLIFEFAGLGGVCSIPNRVIPVPGSHGLDHRIVNGYAYLADIKVEDPKLIEKRAEFFMKRLRYCYEHWDELYKKWEKKILEVIKGAEQIKAPDLPEVEDESIITEMEDTSANKLLATYDKIIQLWRTGFGNYHFTFLSLGYGGYIALMDFCQKLFPDISPLTVAKMVAGIETLAFRPTEELFKLASLAINLGVDEVFQKSTNPEEIFSELRKTDAGKKWLNAFEETKYPWFCMCTATGLMPYTHNKAWIEDLPFLFKLLRDSIEKIKSGEKLGRPVEEVRKEADQIVDKYYKLIKTEEDEKKFRELLDMARTFFPFVENIFYAQNWLYYLVLSKIREHAKILVKYGIIKDPEDIAYLHWSEIRDILSDIAKAWGCSQKPQSYDYCPPKIEKRKEIIKKLKEWNPPPFLGKVPEKLEDPLIVALMGLNTEALERIKSLAERGLPKVQEIKGFPGSPGVAEAVARVILSVDELYKVEEGEILVCAHTAPSWTPVFPKIKGLVLDQGGVMSHGAITCREYRIPAVVGMIVGASVIKTGQRIKLDGNKGIVTILG